MEDKMTRPRKGDKVSILVNRERSTLRKIANFFFELYPRKGDCGIVSAFSVPSHNDYWIKFDFSDEYYHYDRDELMVIEEEKMDD